MADLIKKIKIKKQDGTFTDYIPIGADAANVETSDGESVELKLNKKPYYYNSVADMKADTKLKAGDMAITLGYYEADDGGVGEYKIVNDNTLVDDGGSIHELENGLYAKLVIKNNIKVEQFGAYGDNIHDDTLAIQNALNTHKNIILSKKYKITNTLVLPSRIIIEGQKAGEIYNNTENYTFKFDGSSKVDLNNFKINCLNGLLFTGERSWYTNINNLEIRAVENALKIETATGYNNFNKTQFYVDNDDGIAIIIGKENYAQSIQPNYIYFNECYFTINTAFTQNTATCLKLVNAQYIKFNKCDFVSYNKVFDLICTTVSRSLKIYNCDLFAVYTVFYIELQNSLTGCEFINNTITRQYGEIKYIDCSNSNAYLNNLLFKFNNGISAGGTEAEKVYILKNLFQSEIDNNINMSNNSNIISGVNINSPYKKGSQLIDNSNPTTTVLNIVKDSPFNLTIQPNLFIPTNLSYTNIYRNSNGEWTIGNLQGSGTISW